MGRRFTVIDDFFDDDCKPGTSQATATRPPTRTTSCAPRSVTGSVTARCAKAGRSPRCQAQAKQREEIEMAVTHPVAIRDGICNYVVDQLDLNTARQSHRTDRRRRHGRRRCRWQSCVRRQFIERHRDRRRDHGGHQRRRRTIARPSFDKAAPRCHPVQCHGDGWRRRHPAEFSE